MTACRCTETAECGPCARAISDREDARDGIYWGYSERDLGDMADAAAADMVFGRWDS